MCDEIENPPGMSCDSHLFKAKSINSFRLKSYSTMAKNSAVKSVVSKKASSRLTKKSLRIQTATIDTSAGRGMIDWDGKSIVYIDGGCGTGEEISGRPDESTAQCKYHVSAEPLMPTVLDARNASCVLNSDEAVVVKDVCCILPRRETHNIFTPSSFAAFEMYEKITKATRTARGKKRCPMGTERYMLAGTRSCRSKPGLDNGVTLLETLPIAHKEISRILRNIEHRSARWVDTMKLKYVEESKRLAGYPGFSYRGRKVRIKESSLWPSIACGRNTYLPLHTDPDYMLSAVTVCGHHSVDVDTTLQFFCFPTVGVSVALRHGDILLFNPSVPHCISTRTSTSADCFAFSAYLKSLVVSGNSNKHVSGRQPP